MAKKIVGRTQIEVIDSIPYSQLIFLVASGKSYALTIAEARGKKDSSPTAKQLKQLEARGFLKSQKEKLLNKTIYSVNWEKATNSFVDYVIKKFEECYKQEIEFEGEHKDIQEIRKHLKKRAEKVEYLKEEVGELRNITTNKMNNRIKDKQFLIEIRKNEYIKVLIKNLFWFSERLKDKTIKQSFDDLRIVLRLFDKELFSSVHHPSPKFDNVTEQEVNEYVKKIFEENKKDIQYKQLIEFIEISNSSLFIATGIQTVYHLQGYMQHKYSLICCLANSITKKNLREEYFNEEFQEIFENNPDLKKNEEIELNLFKLKKQPQTILEKNSIKKKLKGKNDLKVTKPIENRHKKAGNTNQNTALSSENNQGESSK